MSSEKKVVYSAAPWRMYEFFAGSGLVGYGLNGMFVPVWANDINERKARVYRANFDNSRFHLGDIKSVNGADLPVAELSWASFPCQDLSLAGSMGGIHAKRSGLVWEWLRVLDEMPSAPKVIALENVVGLLTSHGGDNYRALHRALAERGYRAGAIVLNANWFVPQSRPRVFVVAVAGNVTSPSAVEGSEPCWLHSPAAIKLGEELDQWVWWHAPQPDARTSVLADLLEDAPFDKDDVLQLVPERHKALLEEKEHVVAAGYRRTRGGRQVLELRFDGQAGCLRTPEGGSSRQYVVVKNGEDVHARLLTARETARLMGAPDSFKLPGSYNDGYFAMGDAVAAPVAEFIGRQLLVPLVEASYESE